MSDSSTGVGLSFDQTLQWPIVRRRSHEARPVRTMQFLLQARGNTIAVDGIFGPQTEAAARAFQSAKGLAVDGVVGARTWAALVVTVRRGDRGAAVRGVQQEARDREGGGPSPNAIDRIFGPVTDAFVRSMQTALRDSFPADKVAIDGIVGPVTWRALVANFMLG